MARIEPLLFRAVVVNGHRAFALSQGLFERFLDSFAGFFADDEAVDYQIDRVYLVAVEPHSGSDFADFVVNAYVDVSLAGQRFEQLSVVPFAPFDDGGHQRDAASGESFYDEFSDAVVGVVHHLFARHGRVGPRCASIEQTQKIVDFRDGADGRAGIFVGRFLLDGHYGAQSRDFVDIGAFHRPDELAGIGRERLHVAALSFGIDGIERQRRFARTAQSGDNHQFMTWNFEVHIFQIVNARTEYFDRILFHCR